MRTLLVACVVLSVCACRDLSYPEEGETENAGPELRVLSPVADELLALVHPVNVQAEDANGVSEVRLSCTAPDGTGPAVAVATWLRPPFQGSVELGGCQQVAAPADAQGIRGVRLVFQARDGKGAEVQSQLQVRLDVTVPALSLELGGTLAPNETRRVRIRSDRPLVGVPRATVGGTALLVTADPSAPLTFLGDYTAPELGIQAGGVTNFAPALEELEDLSSTLPVEVEGRTANGNFARLRSTLTVSRVLWDRSVPGTIEVSPQLAPVATPEGLVVPMRSGSHGNEWLPATLSAQTGAFRATETLGAVSPVTLAPGGEVLVLADGGVEGGGGLPSGRLELLGRDGGVLAVYPDAPPTPSNSWFNAGDAVCWEEQIYDFDAGYVLSSHCLRRNGESRSESVPTTELLGFPPPMAISGTSFLTFFPSVCATSCQTSVAAGTSDGSRKLAVLPLTGLTERVLRVLPAGPGRFVLLSGADGQSRNPAMATLFDPAQPASPSAWKLPAATDTGFNWERRYLAWRPAAEYPQGELVRIEASGLGTLLSAWPIGVSATPRTALLPGRWYPFLDSAQVGSFSVGSDAHVGPGNTLALLLSSNDPSAYESSGGVAVLLLDAKLQPLWLYRYPVSTAKARLIEGGPNRLYLVDVQNDAVVGLGR